jgi:hypothetical protein
VFEFGEAAKEDRGSSGLTTGQLLEPTRAIRPEHNRCTVNREAEAAIAASRAVRSWALTVMLDFVDPVGAGGRLRR